LKYKTAEIGGSLLYGSAIDAAVMDLLDGKLDWKQKFYDRWKVGYVDSKAIDVFDNPDVVFANADFDALVLEENDLILMKSWIKELGLESLGSNPVNVFKEVLKIKKNPYKQNKANELAYFRRASWVALNRKGGILLDAFKEQFYPLIEEVLATQVHGSLTDPTTGDSISGYIDFIVRVKGYSSPIIIDLKTAAQEYSLEQAKKSEQLSTYLILKGQEYSTSLVGYVVLIKNIPKEVESYCEICNNKKNSKHKTCDNLVNGKRCGGAWLSKTILKPKVQFLVESRDQFALESLLQDYGSTLLAMKNDIHYRASEQCSNWFGKPCIYEKLCWEGKTDGLIDGKVK
jgi:hypothetical protein